MAWGRPGASGELEEQQPFWDYHFTTMVGVPRSSDDSGCHCEYLRENASVNIEPGIEALAKKGSPQTQGKKVSLDYQCFGRG